MARISKTRSPSAGTAPSIPTPPPERRDGCVPIAAYSAVGDGCTVALSAIDGAIDWWCVRAMDSAPLFDRLLDPDRGGFFALAPSGTFTVERRYRQRSNVLETTYRTATGVARLTESINSGTAGPLPWAELGRRIDGLEGEVAWSLALRPTTRGGTVVPSREETSHGFVFRVGDIMAVLLCPDGVTVLADDAADVLASFTVAAGERVCVGLVGTENEPLVVPRLADIDVRIETSDREWRDWTDALRFEIEQPEQVMRAALALKLLIFSPSGAIAAAATSSLPERIGGEANWDYRYAWVRDCAYTINAFLHVGALPEATAAFTWLIKTVRQHGSIRPCYTLQGERVPAERHLKLPGYAGSQPVRVGNRATSQFQLSLFGDLFDMTLRMVKAGHLLDAATRQQLFDLADECASAWKRKDSGFWELDAIAHFTISKMECWSALGNACDLVACGELAPDHLEHWRRERARILDWINTHCWSESRQAYIDHADGNELDASVLLAPRFGFGLEGLERERFVKTRTAIEAELGVAGGLVYRRTASRETEGAFVATSWWLVEAYGLLGEADRARALFESMVARLGPGIATQSEMIDPETGAQLGNLPQGLSHLALIHAAMSIRQD